MSKDRVSKAELRCILQATHLPITWSGTRKLWRWLNDIAREFHPEPLFSYPAPFARAKKMKAIGKAAFQLLQELGVQEDYEFLEDLPPLVRAELLLAAELDDCTPLGLFRRHRVLARREELNGQVSPRMRVVEAIDGVRFIRHLAASQYVDAQPRVGLKPSHEGDERLDFLVTCLGVAYATGFNRVPSKNAKGPFGRFLSSSATVFGVHPTPARAANLTARYWNLSTDLQKLIPEQK